MAKALTAWKPLSGTGEVNNGNDGDYLKTGASDYLLLSTGGTDRLLLGATVYNPKASTVWSSNDG